MKTVRVFTLALVAVAFCMAAHSTATFGAEATGEWVECYSGMLNQLRTELTSKVPEIDLEKAKTPGSPEEQKLKKLLALLAASKTRLPRPRAR